MMLCGTTPACLLANPLVTLFLFLSLYWHPSFFRGCVLQQATLGDKTSQCKQHGQNVPSIISYQHYSPMAPCSPSFDFQTFLFFYQTCKLKISPGVYFHLVLSLMIKNLTRYLESYFSPLIFLNVWKSFFNLCLNLSYHYNTWHIFSVSFCTCFMFHQKSPQFFPPLLLLLILWTVSMMLSLSL